MKPILIDVFPEWMDGKGIFKTLDGIVTTPWKDDTDGAALDLEYYGNKSGSKIVAPLVEKLLNSDGLSDDKRIALANLIWLKFGTNWSKLWATLTVEYNPIENYSMVEDTTGNTSRNNTASRNNSASSSAATYAFNSTESVDTDSSAQSGTESGTEAETGQHADHHTRSGNIGVTTSQQMLQSERDLWMWKFYEQVFADVDTILCIEVYGESCGDFSQYSGGGSYVLPPATASTLGGVKIGSGIDVTADGTISVEGGSGAVESVNGKTGAVVLNYDDVGSPSLQEFQQIEDDVEDNTILLNNHSTEISNNAGAIQNLYDRSPFRFGVDAEGNYGYYKAGADTVTPFLTGGGGNIRYVDGGSFTTGSGSSETGSAQIEEIPENIIGYIIDSVPTVGSYFVRELYSLNDRYFRYTKSTGSNYSASIAYDVLQNKTPAQGPATSCTPLYLYNGEAHYITSGAGTNVYGLARSAEYTITYLVEEA